MKWRLYKDYFQGPGQFTVRHPGGELVLEVAGDNTFDFGGPQPTPFYGFAAVVGSNRDPLARKERLATAIRQIDRR